jgi:uncharacterized protein YndB with AHSA1/START domain
MAEAQDIKQSVFGSFNIERTFDAPVEKVWAAFADTATKEKWFKGPDDAPNEHSMDFRVGGREHNQGKFHDGTEHQFDALYYDIVPMERIIYTYEMYLDGKRISVSLAAIAFERDGDGTKLTLGESGVFLDGFDRPEQRERGTRQLLDALAASL